MAGDEDLAPLATGPLPVGDGAYRLGILGGTFDPVHAGHVRAGILARDEADLDEVAFMPTRCSNFKRDSALSPSRDRLHMVRLAIAGHEGLCATARELAGTGVAYTADTLAQMRRDYPDNVELCFILGSDSLETLPHWHDAAVIARLATIVCVPREGHDAEAALRGVERSGLGFRIRVLSQGVPDISSTQVRDLIGRGGDPVAEGLLDARVAAYAASRGLYVDGNEGRTAHVQEG